MPPTHLAPSAPVLTHRNLTFLEREEIALECARGAGIRTIARKLGRSPSTILREIRRNSATRAGDFECRAITAQWHAERSAQRPKPSNLARIPALRDYVQDRLSGLIATPDGIAHVAIAVNPQRSFLDVVEVAAMDTGMVAVSIHFPLDAGDSRISNSPKQKTFFIPRILFHFPSLQFPFLLSSHPALAR